MCWNGAPMAELDSRLREALEDLQGYLADHLAPLLVADAFETLLEYPPALTAEQLRVWAFFQFRGHGGATPISDYLYHAIKKVQQLEEHDLMPSERFQRFLAGLALALLEACPEDERERLAGQLRHLRESVGGATALVDHLHRAAATAPGEPRPAAAAAAPAAPLSADEARELRQFTLALERVAAGLGAAGGTAAAAAGGWAQQLLVLAAAGARSGADLEARLEKLRAAGLAPAEPSELVQSLIGAVPDWALALPGGSRAPMSGSLEAVHRAVRLAGNRESSGARWKELLRVAAEQFNRRSFGRALALVDLADRMLRDGEIDARFGEIAREKAHEAYDISVLLEACADRQHWPVIRRLLEFHPAWSVRDLLDQLVFQPDAKKRRLLLAQLEVWGSEARQMVFDRLEASVIEGSRDPKVWWYQRNLVLLLHRLPRTADADAGRELELVAPFSALAQPPSFQKEAIVLLAQLPNYAGVPTLVQRLAEAERALEGPDPPLHPPPEIWKVMNALATALARSGSLSARRALVGHALARRARDGEPLARLRELGRIDLAGDHDTVGRLLAALKELSPRRVLGFVVGRRDEELAHVARALSGTTTPEVREVLAELAARLPEPAPGGGDVAASRAAADDGAGSAVGEAGAGAREDTLVFVPPAEPAPGRVSMAGDLEVFGLAGLLQTFQQSESSGRLALRDAAGRAHGELTLHRGKLLHCRTGRLSGREAFYQLFEVPVPGTFEFTRSEPTAEAPAGALEILGLLMESMRRYDELQRARVLVTDDARLKPTGTRATAPPEESDGGLLRTVWGLVRQGARVADCEQAVDVDALRVRTLLVHWLEEGALALESTGA